MTPRVCDAQAGAYDYKGLYALGWLYSNLRPKYACSDCEYPSINSTRLYLLRILAMPIGPALKTWCDHVQVSKYIYTEERERPTKANDVLQIGQWPGGVTSHGILKVLRRRPFSGCQARSDLPLSLLERCGKLYSRNLLQWYQSFNSVSL